jgi:hypothetical protein
MTLISRYISEDYIIVAADKRVTSFDKVERNAISVDNAQKVFLGENYCIAIQGAARTTKSNYALRIKEFVNKNMKVSPPQLIEKILSEFEDASTDLDVDELNLIISGSDKGRFFSFFVDVKNSDAKECTEDEMGLRFNASSSSDDMLFRQAKIFIHQFFQAKKLLSGYKLDDLSQFDFSNIVDAFKSIYTRFGQNDDRYPYISEKFDLYVIHKGGKIRKIL